MKETVIPESPWEREHREYEENHMGREKKPKSLPKEQTFIQRKQMKREPSDGRKRR